MNINLRFNYSVLFVSVLWMFGLFFNGHVPTTPWTVGLTVMAVGGIGLLLPRAWARDADSAAKFLIAMFAMPILFAGMDIWQTLPSPSRSSVIWLMVSISAIGLCVRSLWLLRQQVDLLPQWIQTFAPAENIWEEDGVQWSCSASGSDLRAGALLLIYLQNNVDAERVIKLKLNLESEKLIARVGVRAPTIDPVLIAPRGHAIVKMQLAPTTEQVIGSMRVYLSLSATGPTAPRNRTWRAPNAPKHTSRGTAALALLFGIFVHKRGGVFMSFSASAAVPGQVVEPRFAVEQVQWPSGTVTLLA